MNRIERAALLIVVTAALGIVASACSKAPAESPPAGAQAPMAMPVTVAAAIERPVAETYEFSGRLEAIEKADLRARVGGYIDRVHFKAGSLVKKGDVLFTIDARPFQQEVSRQEAALASIRTRLDLAKSELARNQAMLSDRVVAQREVDERASSVRDLEASARAAQASLDTARLNLSFTRITAPIAGRIGRAEVTAGNLVEANGKDVLASVMSIDPIFATFEGDEALFLQLGKAAREGSVQLSMGLANEQGFPNQGKLEFVDNRIDPVTGSIRMRAVFANGDGRFTPGLFARIRLAAGSEGKANAVLISDRAIGTDQNNKFVVVVGEGNKTEFRPIKLGQSVEGLRVVHTGLKAGEKIVVNGLQRIRPGVPISPTEVPMDKADQAPATGAPKADAKPAAPGADAKPGDAKPAEATPSGTKPAAESEATSVAKK